MNIDAPVTIANVTFGNALMNGAYIGSKTLADVKRLAETKSGAIVVGSISVEPRTANPGQGYWRHKEGIYSLNSFGMPNGGLPYFEKHLPAMTKIAHAHNKPLIANVIGFSKEEFASLVSLAQRSGADIVELNFGCPNVWANGKQKQIVSYHAELVQDILRHIGRVSGIMVCVKISPLPPDTLQEVSRVIADSGNVQIVTATNSSPNASLSTGTRMSASDKNVLAGLTGRALKPTSLGVVRQLRELLPEDIKIIGCGGISSANDVVDYLAAGASAIQIATALVDEGVTAFDKILLPQQKDG